MLTKPVNHMDQASGCNFDVDERILPTQQHGKQLQKKQKTAINCTSREFKSQRNKQKHSKCSANLDVLLKELQQIIWW